MQNTQLRFSTTDAAVTLFKSNKLVNNFLYTFPTLWYIILHFDSEHLATFSKFHFGHKKVICNVSI